MGDERKSKITEKKRGCHKIMIYRRRKKETNNLSKDFEGVNLEHNEL